ncbi:MAG: T9SS type A sorting domain-containing protein [Chlorobi bacterium]|nr:T9SS type A sorting domain-containing protein [Chlorobiota bacterium]
MKIKIFPTLFFALVFLSGFSQKSAELQQHYDLEFKTFKEFVIKNATFKGDTNIDVKFYHLDIEIGVASPYIEGSVVIRFTPVAEGLNSLHLNLNSALTVDSISAPSESFYQDNDEIVIQLETNYSPGDLIDLQVYYHGVPVMAGGYKGLRYESHGSGEPIIATLSTPYLAHYWYPCKDGPEDKPDSVYVDITIPELTYNGIELMAVSNGVLENVIDNGDTKTFEWRHRYPIVTYYVMAAISNYVEFQEQFNGTGGESYPLIYYVFDEDLAQSQLGVQEMPDAIQFFSDTYGVYPFSNEKYGMTQLGFYGAIENQTNTITNNMKPSWIYISVHELAHMWFGDNITCSDWHHAWLNEGFATYSEALWEEHKYGFNAYKAYISNEEYWNAGTLYLENAQDTFNIFQSIIYSKGSYTLHMLRGVLGDDLFFEALHDYASNPQFMYGNATTEDLQETFENTSGMELGFFFDQWVYDERYPKYFYNYYQNGDNELNLVIYQGQEELWGYRPVFEMPVQIKFNFLGGGDTTITVWNDEQTQEFIFQFENTVSSVAIDPEKWILRKTEFDPDIPVGLSENMENGIRVFPNPFQDKFIVHVPSEISLPANVAVYNAQGKRLICNSILKSGNTTIFLRELPKGVYFYRITNNKDILIKSGKVLKE